MKRRHNCRAPLSLLAWLSLVAPSSAGAQGGNNARPESGPVEVEASSAADEPLASRLGELLASKVRNGTWGAMVVSLTTGDTLFARNAGVLLNPASTLKLYTTALAFEQLGPAHRFTTDVFRTGVLSHGTLTGDLIIRGGGDPALSRRFFDGDGNGPMRALARQVFDAGVRRITGDVIGDDRAFEQKAVPDGWLQRYLHASYAARVSALSLNENLIHIVVTPGRAGQAGSVRLEPATTAFTIANTSTTRAGSRGGQLTITGGEDGVIRVRGWIGARSEARVYGLVVPEPALFTTGAFLRALRDAGVVVEGAARVGGTPPGALKVTSLPSPPLAELAGVMNRESINHYAELIFRNAARVASPAGVGSASMGNALLRDFLELRVGATPQDVFAADGSGLSTLDRVTARSLVKLLSYAHRAPWSREFHESLPVAGRQETLRLRMRGTPAQGNLHAKTGTTNEVVALSGYVAARTGEMLAFAFLYNGKDRWNARATIDAMGVTLADFGR
ncbi:MAG TPA: D-alanyl-D-alanine carboxypeptidase/D-alanyl-D-alanine-endopeptidase [Gemmatimonadaceae bacterium]